MTDEIKPKRRKTPQKYNPAWKDATRNQRTKEREAAYKEMAQRFGYPNKSALLTALLKGEATIVKVEKP